MQGISLRITLFALCVVASAFVLASAKAVSADAVCPNPGDVSITDATRAAAHDAGIPDTVNCWNPSNPYAGADAGKAKEYLRGILCKPDGDNYGGMGPDGTIQGLDAKFAVCAASFLKAASASMPVCVREGARTVEKQNAYVARGVIACTKGAACEHPRGIAIDVNTSSEQNYARLHQSAISFGLIFYLGFKDKVHFVPMKGGCSAGGNVPVNGTIPPTYYDFPQYYTAPTPQPYSYGPPPGFSTPFSATPAPAPSPTSPAQSTPNQNQTQPQICDPKFSCSANVTYYQTTSCSTQVYQVCQYGCATNGTSCATSTSTAATSTSPNPTGTSTNIGSGFDISNTDSNTNSSGDSNGPSVSDLINAIASPVTFTSTDVGTSTSLAFRLNPTTGDVETLGPSERPTSTLAAGTITSIQPVTGQQTFISTDIGNTFNGTYAPQQTSAFQTILNGLQSALLWALNVLKGLGGTPAPAQEFAP